MDASVIVVGAGPSGLVLAAELRLGGADVIVLDRLLQPTGESRGLGFTARTLELFDQRGLLPRFGDVEISPMGHFGGIPFDYSVLEIWLAGTRFHVRDLTGQSIHDLLGDVTAPRQLGAPARTIEQMMDRHDEARHRAPDPRPTELYGDLATGEGWLFPSDGAPSRLSASRLAPVAEQILARDKAAGLVPGATSTRLGRAATEYTGAVTVTEDGEPFRNEVARVIAPPYLLYEDIRSAGGALSYVREIVALDEGGASDADLTPPG